MIAVVVAGCGAATPAPSLTPAVSNAPPSRATVGLGKVLESRDGYQIAGFDIDRNGTDGVFATGGTVETFDQNTGKILKSFPNKDPRGTSYTMNAISLGDIALVTRYVVPKGSIYAKRYYDVMNPVTANKFTGSWTPPVKDIQVEQMGPNQVTSSTALYAIELKHQDSPLLIVSDIAKNSFSKIVHLPAAGFSLGNSPQLAQDTATNQAIFAYSPDRGAVGGVAPVNALVDMKTGKITQFNGLNNGYFTAGDVNGIAVDPKTDIEATDTELNAQVEFYDLGKETATAVQLPCTGTGSQLASGQGIVNDSVNGLFLVTEPEYCNGGGSGAIVVYDEKGDLVETITGFNFAIAEPPPVINPGNRMGWALGPHLNQLQQFFY
ncbi:MAG: hypothetical protein WAK11_02455 [Candidatus Cybelea sp.]